ncbi:two-component system, NtrC family, C4-dicarboxylate transport response regulator DctD [Devosia lucknowensis]|uniref:Two-component system, NtrC family, C4-dicarboxylate transport response regulator DctD n=1 Tax=Devosia lucknowensis TaxID=1096929 RepID=A0A1Y6FDP8_9HYPH|nr:sigma-54 dependent transcriptional regulator [Devosia lucknowensis]SMQ72897.1 two-component system, NtrC family, C4-dicarboxylate transport response regulator DctD [Devosia lucknowensis]
MIPTVLIVDDEDMVRTALEQWLRLSGFETATAANAQEALAAIDDRHPHIVLTDVRMPGLSGMDLLRSIAERGLPTEVILITGHGDVPMAVEAMRAGAFDFLQKPYVPDQLVHSISRAAEQARLKRELADLRRKLDGGESELSTRLVGASRVMGELRRSVLELAPIPADIILFGETGTGKEVVARCLHDFSPRAGGPFVAVNCAAIPAELIESELFGHEAGSFTGAAGQRIGKFEYANGGTLLLDEIESMPLLAQAKVLRVIQERVVERLGSNKQVALDLRIIAASKVDLAAESQAGRFRADLYYRLNMATLALPPLRDRGDDCVILLHHFLSEAARRFGRPAPTLHPADISALLSHGWPGNVRELKAAADRFALGLGATGRSIGDILGQRLSQPTGESLADRLASYERHLIEAELDRNDNSIAAAAEALQVPRRTLSEKMSRLGVRR